MLNIIISLSQCIIGIGIIIYWICFYLFVKKDTTKTPIYVSHEKSFPIADLCWAMPTLFLASIGLLTSQRSGIFFSIISGSSLIFLGLLDITFNVQNKVYSNKLSDTIVHLFINISCMSFGTIFIVYGWLSF